MALTPGTRVGAYDITAAIGEGGMGQVYRATDARLKRQVAIKVLPPSLATDADRLARFQREAEVLASLNHPNIAAIYGLEDSEGMTALVMELVEGDDLSQRIAQGAMPFDEALPIAKQIAEALEAAHEHGIIHRDLKPANIKVRPDGTVKVLDFGLAKVIDGAGGTQAAGELLNSPTITSPAAMTVRGMILGTAAYMAPEQAKGKTVDKRADVWAFGCVLYEMLTGRRAFAADDVADTLAAVLTRDLDLEALPAGIPANVRWLIRRCLERDPNRRLHDMADARLLLDDEAPGARETKVDVPARGPRPFIPALAALSGLIVGASVMMWLGRTPSPAQPLPHMRFDLTVTEKDVATFRPYMSPDGRRIAYFTDSGAWMRWLDRSDAPRKIASVEGVQFIFWSPDQEWLGLVTIDAILKVPANGGDPVRVAGIAQLGNFSTLTGGALWLTDNRIVFTTGFTGLLAVSALGGEPTPVVTPEPGADFHGISRLPDGSFLYAVHVGDFADTLEVWRDGARKVIYRAGGQSLGNAVYSPTGHILLQRFRPDSTGSLWALPFSVETQQPTGAPFMVSEDVAHASLSADGALLVTIPDRPRGPGRLALVGRDGRVRRSIGPRLEARFVMPTLSPDGSRVAATTLEGSDVSLWVYGVDTDSATRVAEHVSFASAAWWPDGRRIVVQTGSPMCFTGNCYELALMPLDGSHAATKLATGWSAAVSLDGQHLLYSAWHGDTDWDLEYQPETGGVAKTFVTAPSRQFGARFSPDGRHVAYVSRETGRDEVYVTTFPDPRNKWRISNGGGDWPVWQKDGKKLFFAQGGAIREVAVATSPAFALGSVIDVLPVGTIQQNTLFMLPDGFDVTADGSTFVVFKSEGERPAPVMTVIQNWLAGVAATK